MRVTRNNDQLLLLFSQFEVGLLRHVLREVLENYQIKPGELDAKTAAVWYSQRGCQGAQMSAEETQEWLAQLHGFNKTRANGATAHLIANTARAHQIYRLLGLIRQSRSRQPGRRSLRFCGAKQ